MVSKGFVFGRKNNFKKIGANLLHGLVAYYKFDTNLADSSGNGYNGTCVGGVLFNNTTNLIGGGCLNLINNTTNVYVNIPDNNDFSFTDGVSDIPFTIMTWIRIRGFSPTGNWFVNKRGMSSGTDEYQLIYLSSTNTFQFTLFDKNDNSILMRAESNAGAVADEWYSLVGTYDGSGTLEGLNLYVNGVLQNNKTFNGTFTGLINSTSLVRLGNIGGTPSANFKQRGNIDDTAIWKGRELKATEVSQLYNTGNSGLSLI